MDYNITHIYFIEKKVPKISDCNKVQKVIKSILIVVFE